MILAKWIPSSHYYPCHYPSLPIIIPVMFWYTIWHNYWKPPSLIVESTRHGPFSIAMSQITRGYPFFPIHGIHVLFPLVSWWIAGLETSPLATGNDHRWYTSHRPLYFYQKDMDGGLALGFSEDLKEMIGEWAWASKLWKLWDSFDSFCNMSVWSKTYWNKEGIGVVISGTHGDNGGNQAESYKSWLLCSKFPRGHAKGSLYITLKLKFHADQDGWCDHQIWLYPER